MAVTEAEPPLAERVILCVALVVPTPTLPKVKLEGLADNVMTCATCAVR